MARVLVKDVTTELSTDIGIVTIPGEVKAYAGAAAPTGFLFCHGQAVSRTTYADLYAILGDSHGSGDGSTTFNVPDYRGSFLRGLVNVTTATGSGTVSSGAATFTAHGFNRTGFKVRLSGAGIVPLSFNVDYYVIVVDANTLRFATTKANALAGIYIAITGTNSAVLTQWEDPDYASRERLTGGANTTGLGAFQDDAAQSHNHKVYMSAASGTISGLNRAVPNPGDSTAYTSAFTRSDCITDVYAGEELANGANGTPRMSTETRSKNVLINYIIKY